MSPQNKYLVLGATGATGKHVMYQLLDQGHSVTVIVRSKSRVLELLKQKSTEDQLQQRLDIIEAGLLDLTNKQIQQYVHDVDAVIMCLGHNLTFKGIFGHPRRLVTDAVRRFTTAMQQQGTVNDDDVKEKKIRKKFILMGSDGVDNPAGTDDKRSYVERCILFMLRWIIPPHADNEDAASYLHNIVGVSGTKKSDASDGCVLEWVVVRPTDLISLDDNDYNPKDIPEYEIHDKPQGGLFGSGVATRTNVARFMVKLATSNDDDETWERYKFQMPFLWDKPSQIDPSKAKTI